MNKDIITITNEEHDEERAFYGLARAELINCAFCGPLDGESALKECEDIKVIDCRFSLRYPLWHDNNFEVENCSIDENARAAVWYSQKGVFTFCNITGAKIFRECNNISVENSYINSIESSWKCRGISFINSLIESEYFLLESKDIKLERVKASGKYCMQYVENALIEDSEIDTKDALWHAKNVTVKNSVLKGEYLGWYSEGLTLINCEISGTQPLCHCKKLKLINCKMPDCDLAFELSDVEAELIGTVKSIRSPLSGEIVLDGVGEIINDVKEKNLSAIITLRK